MTMKDAFVGFITVVFSVIVIGIVLYFEGYVFVNLWDWFIVPVLNLPTLSIYMAIGVKIFVSFLTRQLNVKQMLEERTTKEKWLEFAMIFIRPAAFLFCGYLMHLLMGSNK